MNEEQPNRKPNVDNSVDSKPSKPSELVTSPKTGSPMDIFNNAMRKILSVPKKDIKKK